MVSTRNLNLALAADGLKQPLHLRIRQLLRERILSDFEDGQRFFSERELMEKLSVSQPTIHRALGDLVEEGYLQREPRRGFFVRRAAASRCVGLVAPGVPGHEFLEACREAGCGFEFHPLHREDGVDEVMASLRRKPSEERILMSGLTVELALALSARLQAEGYQHLIFGARIPGFAGGSIGNDVEAEIDQVLDHLTGLGHKRIAFVVNEPRVLVFTSQRAEMVRRKIAERGLSQARLIFCDTHNWDNSFVACHRKVEELLAESPRPTAIVPLSGAGAWAAMKYALLHGVRVPEELSIVSLDPMTNGEFFPLRLTELALSYLERARAAVAALWSDHPAETNSLVRPVLVPGETTGPAPQG